jgi:hypothetical protein
VVLTTVGCDSKSYEPTPPVASSLVGTTQTAVLVGYDAKAKLVEFSPAVLYVGGNGMGNYEAVAGASTYKFPLASDPTVLSAKELCPAGKPDGKLTGTTPCTVDQLIVALMARPQGSDPIGARVTIDPYGEVTKVAEIEGPGN